jgi:hypothetical protein
MAEVTDAIALVACFFFLRRRKAHTTPATNTAMGAALT